MIWVDDPLYKRPMNPDHGPAASPPAARPAAEQIGYNAFVSKVVHIRPIVEADLALLESLYADPDEASQYGFFGYRSLGWLRRGFAEKGLISEDHGRLAVALGAASEPGEFIGEVSWQKAQTGPTSFGWSIGIGLLAKARGQGYGTRAQRLLAEYLFAHTQVNRVAAETEVDNVAEQRSLEKAGFTREGILRGSCFRDGRWRDMASYSIVRADVDLG
jgi:RimJ/RimL family protein N-acetyltransferase